MSESRPPLSTRTRVATLAAAAGLLLALQIGAMPEAAAQQRNPGLTIGETIADRVSAHYTVERVGERKHEPRKDQNRRDRINEADHQHARKALRHGFPCVLSAEGAFQIGLFDWFHLGLFRRHILPSFPSRMTGRSS